MNELKHKITTNKVDKYHNNRSIRHIELITVQFKKHTAKWQDKQANKQRYIRRSKWHERHKIEEIVTTTTRKEMIIKNKHVKLP